MKASFPPVTALLLAMTTVAAMTPAQAQPRSGCPPGLAAKSPACQPPGQARKSRQGGLIGQVIPPSRLHIVTNPGFYGLGNPPAGDSYAIVDGRLVRIDSQTRRVLSIIRLIDKILD